MAVNASTSVSTCATVTQNVLGNMTGRKGIQHDRKLSDVTKAFVGQYTGTTSLDMTTGLTDPFGAALAFATVKVVQVKNNHVSTNLVVTGNVIGTDQITVGPGRCVYLDTERTVDGSHKVLALTGGSVPFDIIILGS